MRRSTRLPNINLKMRSLSLLITLVALCALVLSSNLTLTSRPGRAAIKTVPASPKQNKSTGHCGSCSPPGNQLIYIPLIDLPEARGGELVFNSRSPQAMEVTPVFYKRSGETVLGAPVNIQSAEIRYVNIYDLLPDRYRHEKDWGGFALSYFGSNREMWSQFRFMGVNGEGNVDEFFTVKDESRSSVYEAAWWMPEKSEAIVALGNISDTPTSATVSFGGGLSRTVNLQPHATELVRQESRNEGSESVKINVTGAVGTIVPTGIITTKNGSFNSVIRFYDPTKVKQPNLYANGFRVKGTTPHMVLKNTTQSSIAVLPKIIPLDGSRGTLTLSQVSLNANETKEVDLSELLQAARSRTDLDLVSVAITNWAAPGSVIGSLYTIDNHTHTDYDVPLRDSGPIRSMTGAYPWKIDADYKSVAYVTNITDEAVGYVVELAYDGGKFTLGPQTLQPRATASFDLGKIHDGLVTDIGGHPLPRNITQGQFKWAIRGASNGKIVLIGRIEMVSRSHNVSSSYSCPMDCGPNYEAEATFPSDALFNGQPGQASVTETASWNYGYTIGPYAASASWSADDPIVAFDPSQASSTTLSPIDAGETTVNGFVGWYDRNDWDGLECVYSGSYPEILSDVLDMFAAVEFLDARIYSTGGEYSGDHGTFIPIYNNTDLQTHSSSVPSACGGDNFVLKVTFRLPDNSANCCLSSNSFVTIPPNDKFRIAQVIPDPDNHTPNMWEILWYGADSPPYVQIGLKATGSGTNDAIRIKVGGEYQSHDSYSGFATVHIKCPQ